ncbi:MAG: WD40 repeat domain-containing protein, partial [Acidimicrobiia bacterium]
RELVSQSLDRRDADRAAEDARRGHELDVERKSVRRLRWLVGATTVAVLVVSALSAFAVNRSREAVANEHEARARELANAARNTLAADPELAVLLALEAVDTTRATDGHVLREAEEALHLALNSQRLVGKAMGEGSLVFAPSGELVTGGDRVRFVDPTNGSVVRELAPTVGNRRTEAVAVSPDGRFLATGEDHYLLVRDALSGDVVMKQHLNHLVTNVAFSPDGRMVAGLAPYGDGIGVFRIDSAEAVLKLREPNAWPRDDCCPTMALKFNPEGDRIVATTWSGQVLVVDIATSERVATLTGHDGPVSDVAYLAGEHTMVTSSFDGSVRFWDADTGSELSSFDPGVGQVASLAVSPHGDRLLTGGDGGAVKLWTVSAAGTRLQASLSPAHTSFVVGVAFDDSGGVAASVGYDDGVRVWDVAPRGEVAAWSAGRAITFAGGGTHIATTGPDRRSVIIRRTSDWRPETVLTEVAAGAAPSSDMLGPIAGIAVNPALDRVAVVSATESDTSGSVTVWDAANGEKIHTLLEDAFAKGSVDFSDDGRLLTAAVCNRPGPTAYVWNVATGEEIFSTPTGDCGQSVDLDPAGRLLAVQTLYEDEPNVRVWDIGTGNEVFARDHYPAWIGAVQFSPDGSQLLTGGGDGTVIVWDVTTGDLKRVLTGHTGAVEDATWSSDGLSIISGSHDGTVRVWDVTSGETLVVLEGHDTWPFVDMTPDRRYVVTATPGTVRVWTLDIDELTGIARARVGRSLNAAECLTYHFTECPTAP